MSSIEVDRPPSEVFAYATDPSRFAEWQHDVVSVRVAEDGPPRAGLMFTTTRRMGGVDRTMTQELTQVDTPNMWAARGIDGPIRPHVTIAVEPLDGDARSRVTFALDFEGHGIGVPLVPIVRRMAAKAAPASCRNLRERLEGGEPDRRLAPRPIRLPGR
ncbi:MAG: SRPBCC family protein [Acidimicrobiales bacterium]